VAIHRFWEQATEACLPRLLDEDITLFSLEIDRDKDYRYPRFPEVRRNRYACFPVVNTAHDKIAKEIH
jgi:hypothetical protein